MPPREGRPEGPPDHPPSPANTDKKFNYGALAKSATRQYYEIGALALGATWSATHEVESGVIGTAILLTTGSLLKTHYWRVVLLSWAGGAVFSFPPLTQVAAAGLTLWIMLRGAKMILGLKKVK